MDVVAVEEYTETPLFKVTIRSFIVGCKELVIFAVVRDSLISSSGLEHVAFQSSESHRQSNDQHY